MRARIDSLRVQANLGKMELRDKLEDVGGTLKPAYHRAKDTLAELVRGGAGETVNLAKSLQAGWSELLETHSELSKKAQEEAEREHQMKRK